MKRSAKIQEIRQAAVLLYTLPDVIYRINLQAPPRPKVRRGAISLGTRP
jgi:hypothetical protein